MEPVGTKVAQCVCGSVRKAARTVTKIYDDALRPAGIRITQLGILGAAVRLGPLTVTQLAEVTLTDRTTLTRNLKLLEQKGLVRIEPGSDQREREITITNQGRDAVRVAYPIWQEVQAKVIEAIGAERWDVLKDGLAVVASLGKDE